jgi:hypothetical protein
LEWSLSPAIPLLTANCFHYGYFKLFVICKPKRCVSLFCCCKTSSLVCGSTNICMMSWYCIKYIGCTCTQSTSSANSAKVRILLYDLLLIGLTTFSNSYAWPSKKLLYESEVGKCIQTVLIVLDEWNFSIWTLPDLITARINLFQVLDGERVVTNGGL